MTMTETRKIHVPVKIKSLWPGAPPTDAIQLTESDGWPYVAVQIQQGRVKTVIVVHRRRILPREN